MIVLRKQFSRLDGQHCASALGPVRSSRRERFVAGALSGGERSGFRSLAIMGVSTRRDFCFSRRAASDLEIGMECSATIQEYLRTVAIREPVWVAMEPLAVWAENGADTGRDLGETAGWFLRELKLKRSVQHLQRHVWATASDEARAAFLEGSAFVYSPQANAGYSGPRMKSLLPAIDGGRVRSRVRREMARTYISAVGSREVLPARASDVAGGSTGFLSARDFDPVSTSFCAARPSKNVCETRSRTKLGEFAGRQMD